MTMHTNPLSPLAVTLYPEVVSILTVARAETFSGAALLARATSASGAIMYSLSGGYLEPWANPAAASKFASTRHAMSRIEILRVRVAVIVIAMVSPFRVFRHGLPSRFLCRLGQKWRADSVRSSALNKVFTDTSFFRFLQAHGLSVCVGSGIHSAIHGKIRPGNVRGLRTGDKRHQRSDLINVSVAVECCGGLLRCRPIARGGIQIRVDRTRLHVVDRDAPAPELSGQPLSKYLHGSLRGRVGHKPGDQDTLTHGRADHNDATATLHVLQRRLRRDEYAADVDVDHAIHLLERGLLERFRNGCAGIVHKDVEPAECRHCLFDRGFDGAGISGVRLNCDRLSASAFNLIDDRRGRIGTFRVCDGHVRSVRSQTLGDCSTNAARATRNECNLSFQFLRHCFSPIPYNLALCRSSRVCMAGS